MRKEWNRPSSEGEKNWILFQERNLEIPVECLKKKRGRDTLLSLSQLSLHYLFVVSITLFSIELLTWSSSLEEEQRGCLEELLQQQ